MPIQGYKHIYVNISLECTADTTNTFTLPRKQHVVSEVQVCTRSCTLRGPSPLHLRPHRGRGKAQVPFSLPSRISWSFQNTPGRQQTPTLQGLQLPLPPNGCAFSFMTLTSLQKPVKPRSKRKYKNTIKKSQPSPRGDQKGSWWDKARESAPKRAGA